MAGVRRQLLIGLDAAEWDLIRQWTAAGKLPTFKRLMDEGTQAELAGPSDQLPDTAWACLLSGLNPAHLGRYFYAQHDPSTGGMHSMDDGAFGVRFLWEQPGASSLRIGVLDAPHVTVAAPINGFHLARWGSHASRDRPAAVPPSLLDQVNRQFGRHPVGECDQAGGSPSARKALRDRLLAGVRVHGALFRHFARQSSWDILIAAFAASHCAGHLYWHYMDPSHPRHDPADPHQLADTIEQVYRAIDSEIAALLEAVGDGVRVYVVAANGMGPLYHASWNLPEMLDSWGYGGQGAAPSRTDTRRAGRNMWRLLRMTVPGAMQETIRRALPERIQNELIFRYYRGNRDWSGARAFAVPNNDGVGAIRINLKGRDHNGLVDPTEYEPICDDICEALAELRDPVSGRPVARRISRLQRELRGPHLELLPDITVQWEQSFPWNQVQSPRFGTLELQRQDSRTGTHTAHGFLLASGDGIAKGARLSGATIYDIVPTVLSAAGARVLECYQGHPLFSDSASA
ncbi:MAG TPA: alkaline phosphatase family protein [Candidatus Binataceae bacterium]|nr:alkaline phosphatase family protein [Candidatus Binataceae bacterium]